MTTILEYASPAVIASIRARKDGLLRGACHPAALRADRVVRNDAAGITITAIAELCT